MSVIDKAVQWAVDIANDNSHGYDQINRWGKDYDCSSLVISAYQQAGIPVKTNGASYTGNMKNAFIKSGFQAIKYVKGMQLIKGDVLLNESHHTAMYIGNNQIVQASINEKGTIKGGKTGDQTGREIYVGKFYEYSKGWQYVLRYTESAKKETNKVIVELTALSYGMKGAQVKAVQRMLRIMGYKGANGKVLTIDGDYGSNTLYAVKSYQKANGLTQDGVVGQLTWNKLLKG